MSLPTKYVEDVHEVHFGNRQFVVRNIIPCFEDMDYDKARQQIETCLYDIFRKYMT